MNRGVFIAEEGKSLDRREIRYRSDRPHMQASLLAKDPPHMDITEMSGGTALATTGIETKRETILTLEHGLSYTPEVLLYFYVVSYDGSTTDPRADTYYDGRLIMLAGTVDDLLMAEVDKKEVRIVHELSDFVGLGHTSDGPKWNVRLKYYILSLDSHVEEYNTRGY